MRYGVVLVLALLAFAPGAEAAYPGANGPLAVVTDSGGDDEIAVLPATGDAGPVAITNNPAADIEPSWSPLAGRIAFASDRDGDFEIYTATPKGGDVLQLTNNAAEDRAPRWSRDGTRILFSSTRDGDPELFTMRINGTDAIQLTDAPGSDTEPAWSPDNERIAFTSDRDGDPEILVMDADGSAPTALTANAVADSQPTWAPDGKRIAFTSARDGDPDIHAMTAAGTRVTQLTENPAADTDAAWSPDGQRIAFASTRFGASAIFTMNPAGGQESQLAELAAALRLPDWQRPFKLKVQPQRASNVSATRRGTFVVIEFDQRYKTARPRVELWNDGVVTFQAGGPEKRKHWKIKVTRLEPETEYELRFALRKPFGGGSVTQVEPYLVRTLGRTVTVKGRSVKVHDDTDDLSDGEFVFDFRVAGQKDQPERYGRMPKKGWHDIGTGATWDPADVRVDYERVRRDTVKFEVVGVDDDQDPFEVPYTCTVFAGCVSLGDSAVASTPLALGPDEYTVAGEEHQHSDTLYARRDDGLRFTFSYSWSVRYE